MLECVKLRVGRSDLTGRLSETPTLLLWEFHVEIFPCVSLKGKVLNAAGVKLPDPICCGGTLRSVLVICKL